MDPDDSDDDDSGGQTEIDDIKFYEEQNKINFNQEVLEHILTIYEKY